MATRTPDSKKPIPPTGKAPPKQEKGSDANRSDSAGYAEYETERETMGRGRPEPTQRSHVVPKK